MEPNSEDEVMSVVVEEEDGEEVGSAQPKEQEPATEVTSVDQLTSEESGTRQTETEADVEVEGAVGGVSVTDDNTEQPEATFLKQSFDHLSDKVSLYRSV